MSSDQEHAQVQDQDVEMAHETPPRASYKSYKKKYRKIMITFEERMSESNNYFREEQRMLDISRRLSEQTDQLLELLHDLNSCPQLPPRYRYDLDVNDSAARTNHQKATEDRYDVPAARAALKEARNELRSGELSPVEFKRLEDSILRSGTFAPSKSYLSLLSTPHAESKSTGESHPLEVDLDDGYVSPRHEEQYLLDLDAYLTGDAPSRRPNSYNNLAKTGDRGSERDRDTALRNPVSVYNWLRKNQPQVFLQDKENDGGAPNKSANARSTKRGSLPIKQEDHLYDDDGIALDAKTSSRGKRKRDDDGGYRPKGGGSRSTKRKREDGSSGGGGSRRGSKKIDIPVHVTNSKGT